jgi:hypothetical protein
VLKIEVLNQGGGYALGSGVRVAADQVATNCHVTRQAHLVHVLQGGARWRAEAQAADLPADLCVLRVQGLQGSVVPLAPPGSLQPGDAVVAVGYTGGLATYASVGTLLGRQALGTGEVLRTNTQFNSGASGGGLFDTQGRLLGLLTFRQRGPQGHSFAVPVALPAAQAFGPVGPLQGQTFWEAAPADAGLPPAARQPTAAGTAAPPAATPAEAPSAPLTDAERLLFNAPHLAALRLPAALDYRYTERTGTSPAVEDSASLRLSANDQGRCCAASARYLSGTRALRLPDLPDATANPVLLYFLEHQIRQLQAATGGQAAHFRRRIRLVLAEPGMKPEPVVMPWAGREVQAQRVTLSPYLADPQRHRFERWAGTRYTFILSDHVPGMVLQLQAHLPQGDTPTEQTLTLQPPAPAPR